MTARELALQILALPEDQQALQVHRGDSDYDIVLIKKIEVENAHTWSAVGITCVDYDPEGELDDDGETKFKILRLQ